MFRFGFGLLFQSISVNNRYQFNQKFQLTCGFISSSSDQNIYLYFYAYNHGVY